MCFSATASFSIAAATGAIGIASLKQARQRHEIPIATIPILLAGQQTIEGMLWLLLPGGGAPSSSPTVASLAFAFLFIAEVVWPLFVPIAVLLIEPDRRRRLILQLIAALGVILSIYVLQALLDKPPTVIVHGHSLRYSIVVEHLSWQPPVYLLCTCVSLLVSSHQMIRIIGAVVVIGLVVSAYAYYAAFVSVWCFFTAADSTLLYFHFKRMGASIQPITGLPGSTRHR